MRYKAGPTTLAVAILTGLVTAAPPVHAGPGTPPGPAGPGAPVSGKAPAVPGHGDITLITGDRVTVLPGPQDGPPQTKITPGKGRSVTFTQRWRDGHLHVIPSDAREPLARGLLDERLFDVTQLLAWGYGDDRRDDIPVIVQSNVKTAAPPLKAAEDAMSFTGLGLTSSHLPKSRVTEAWKSLGASTGAKTLVGGVTKLWLDGKRAPALERSVPQIGAPTAWAQGLTGEGVTVAVLDTGYDPTHPDLRDAVVQARSFDPEDPDVRDRDGHGTHVASTVAGSGQASGGRHKGVAPGAKLAIGKLGTWGFSESAVLAGMIWAATEVKAKVVNMSLSGFDRPGIDPLEHAVNALTAETGTLFVVAAGNDGPQSVTSPGSADAALTVGAVDKNDGLADFSSTGPRNWDKAIKPDITAPGVAIIAAAAAGTAPGPYTARLGTSMAAPHVAGAAAILAQRHPTWTAEQLKAALIGSAVHKGDAGVFGQGAGRVDVARASTQTVTASPATLSTRFPWPHTGGPVAKTVVYRNWGTTPLTLDLTVEQSGAPLPQGLLELPDREVTVPAGGEAPVTFTLHPAASRAGTHAGVLVARSGEATVRTPVGAHVEPESHDQVIETIGADGGPSLASIEFYNPATGERVDLPTSTGRITARLPLGNWNVYSTIYTPSDRGTTFAHLPFRVEPGGAPLVLDARKGKQITFSVDEPTAVPNPELALTFVNRRNGKLWFESINMWLMTPNTRISVLPSRYPGTGFSARTVWQKRDTYPSPYRYDLIQHHQGGLPDNPTMNAKTTELAKVTATYRSTNPAGGTVFVGTRAYAPGEPTAFPQATALPLPGTLTHYRVPGKDIVWGTTLFHDTGQFTEDQNRTLRRRHYTEVWNNAVFGPAPRTATRTGDELRYRDTSLFADGTPGRTSTDSRTTGTITLTEDGQTLGRTEYTECLNWEPYSCSLTARLPAAGGVYTLTSVARRDPGVGALSTKVETAWTFRSARTATAAPLPLTTVRYTPLGLDTANRARRGTLTPIPLRVERAPGVPEARVTSIQVEASADDGVTWWPIPVLPTADGWTAFVLNPAAGDFVTLRTAAADRAGTTVKQTITRAYALTR
ncbi:S8 family serine peptidase [Rhizohabitans arisaemae]|uniref:S8 family serine peptidase n=1 Tax=Rhizohabitans arisaemae TaxID=2720610 RepID=UPI0024B1DAE0|nr:S8 family serine peptidase [Rhizohabitans arisaemae]